MEISRNSSVGKKVYEKYTFQYGTVWFAFESLVRVINLIQYVMIKMHRFQILLEARETLTHEQVKIKQASTNGIYRKIK